MLRTLLTLALLLAALPLTRASAQAQAQPQPQPNHNLALWAAASTSFVSGHETLTAIHDGFEPAAVDDHSHGAYGNWPQTGTQWVQYEWTQPISTAKIDVYWWDDARGVRLPASCRLLYWDGQSFTPVKEPVGLGVDGGRYNTTTFAPITTNRLRLEITGSQNFSTGILEWKVHDTGSSPKFPPKVHAGPDRIVILPEPVKLQSSIRGPSDSLTWSQTAGPSPVTFADPHAPATTATFSHPGQYRLRLTASHGPVSSHADILITAASMPTQPHLQFVEPTRFTLTSPFWTPRIKAQIVRWIPHCVDMLNRPGLKEGGMHNFIESAHKLANRPHQPHAGQPWSDAYVYNTLESMCLARMVDPAGDPQIIAAQTDLAKAIDAWIPMILAAQEPDGYLQTFYTLTSRKRWSQKADHEGYVAAYFIEAAMAHYLMTAGSDTRLYDAAIKLADCWDRHIGPAPKRTWYDGHQALEQALVRLAWFVNQRGSSDKAQRYLALAKFLTDSRRGGDEYDQSHLPVVEQTQAVGHAVRAVYLYAGMAALAMSTHDPAYHSAVLSLWDNIAHRKYYITGGVGSGETSEGFGHDFSLPNNAYCESCSGCGMLMFEHKMHMIHRDAHYADAMEETLYNAILGSVDLPAAHFTYTNALDSSESRYLWHVCPCCVGNIPRTLLMLPTWMYTQLADDLYINLYIGSTVQLGDVQLVQDTHYPWDGKVAITVNPAAAKTFKLHLRIPSRSVSRLYTPDPAIHDPVTIKLNGQPMDATIDRGYAVLSRTWQPGDRIEINLPMKVQRVRADERITATTNRVALRYGPLIYNIESIDQNIDSALDPAAPLTLRWRPDLLEGVMAIESTFTDGKPMTAIPNYARLNRGGRSIVWIREQK
jgi:DUF1680 family protein